MAHRTARHLADEQLLDPASYLTVRRGDQVYDLYGWAAGKVDKPRITEDELFDGVVVDFRGRHVFVDAPEVRAIHQGIVVLGVTVADLARAASDRGPCQASARRAGDTAAHDDAVALVAALSRMYVADRLSLPALERDVERALSARTCGDLDAIADELLATAS